MQRPRPVDAGDQRGRQRDRQDNQAKSAEDGMARAAAGFVRGIDDCLPADAIPAFLQGYGKLNRGWLEGQSITIDNGKG
ncbi:MAG TPA: hypothetical protein VGN04_13620 [Herbaspirillum sp.]|jgi:hypothetical protein